MDDCDDVIVSLVGFDDDRCTSSDAATAPPPFPSTCTCSAAVTEQQLQLQLQLKSSSKSSNESEGGEEERKRQIYAWYHQAWNGNKKRRKWTPTLIQRQTWSILSRRQNTTKSNTSINLIAVAPTSSGKTLAYGMPMLSVCQQQQQQNPNNKNNRKKRPRNMSYSRSESIVGLVLVPTRELCAQVKKELSSSSNNNNSNGDQTPTPTTVVAIYGGSDDRDEQVAALKERPTIVVATPGRFIDILQHQKRVVELFSSTTMNTNGGLDYVVLDEADRLATTKDFAEQVDQILHLILGVGGQQQQQQPQPTVALFSATAPHKAKKKWAEWVGPKYMYAKVKANNTSLSVPPASPNIKDIVGKQQQQQHKPTDADYMSKIPEHLVQTMYVCTALEKPNKLLTTLATIQKLDGRQRSLVIVFFREIKTLVKMSQFLSQQPSQPQTTGKRGEGGSSKKKSKSKGLAVAEIHGKLSQSAREQTLRNFRSGKTPILLATDIFSRGLHVPNVWYVINYDFPAFDDMEQYVHRCGRAARNATPQQIAARPPATIYSFVTRDNVTTAMASNTSNNVLSSLLRSTTASIDDPKMAELATSTAAAGEPSVVEEPAKQNKNE
jgi:superfamily II DNA/RNA helicase